MKRMDIAERSSNKIDLGRLEDSSGFLISVAQAYVFERFFESLGRYGLRPGMISALIVLRRNPGIRHGELAKCLNIKLARTTKMLKGFEANGWLDRSSPKHDRRIVELYLTPAGEAYVDEMAPIMFEHDSNRTDGLTSRERQQLKRLLKKFVARARDEKEGRRIDKRKSTDQARLGT